MKIHALLLLLGAALVAVVSATSEPVIQLPAPPEEPECTGESEGDRWRKDCNWCRCNNGREVCTRRLCMEGQEVEGPVCEGTPTWKDDCNTCSCRNGWPLCTLQACERQPRLQTVEFRSRTCKEGSRWRVACNWCFCENGRSICTEAACTDWSEAKAVEEGILECHGESRWKKDCNWCNCVNGRGRCTTLGCIPPERDPFRNLPEDAVCLPGSRWLKDCNWCSCGENGFAACTLKGCLPGFKAEEPTCQEGSLWKDDCNICRCINGGSACSKRLCLPEETPDSNIPQLPQEPQCQGEEEGAFWSQDCNRCRCRNGVSACTKRLCREGQRSDSPACGGDVSWQMGCHRCRCVNGTTYCTAAFCENPMPAAHTQDGREPECRGEEERARWRKDCNWCQCRNGVAGCTKRLCNEDEKYEGPVCEGNVVFKKDCNWCHCVNGIPVCTLASCGLLLAQPALHSGVARRQPECQGEEEEDSWMQDCNRCRCRNGVGACTKRLCPEGQRHDGPECTGNVSWKKDCNRCRCVNGAAVCTTAFCGPFPPPPSSQTEVQEPQCQGDPDTDSWIQDCNLCRCIDGGVSCTRRLCRQGEESLPICVGNPSWKKDCNHCHCNNGTAVCTTKHCGGHRGTQRSLSVRTGRGLIPEMECANNSRWRVECNWCTCNNYKASCTEKACTGNPTWNTEPECKGVSIWKKDCNWCACVDGRSVCTKVACIKNTQEVCTEGSSWKENCNICRCSQGFVVCTKRACAKQSKMLECQGDSCSPSELPELCSLPPTSGPRQCVGFFMKWTFSLTEGKCKQIVYGGCAGTANLFDSRAECEAACPSPAPNTHARRLLPVAKAVSSGGERCTLPKVQGPCFAAFQRYAYNPVTGACEAFFYGGCGGNANNFITEEECVAACQACDKSKCSWNLWEHYLAKECVPQYAGDSCCPTSFQCPSASESGKDPTQCHYKGVAYKVGDSVPVENPCSASCRCSESSSPSSPPEIICANVECPSLFRPPTPGCRPLFRADMCCAYDHECVDPASPPLESRSATCVWQNKTYLEGDKMYFDDYPCLSCICGPGFTDPNGPGCFKIDCGLSFRYTSEFHRGCSPIIFERDGCCPISWMCPDDSRIEPQQQQQQQQQLGTTDASGVCRLGDLQFRVGEKLGLSDCKIDCRCVTPPELTCIQYRSCEVAQEIAAQKECPPLECSSGCHPVAGGLSECPTCYCSPDNFTCPAQTCPSSCHIKVDLQTGCPTCKCKCPRIMRCPNGCPVHTVLDEATGCPRCECQSGSPQTRRFCPAYPGGRVPCPQDCAVITTVDENGCERCVCDPTESGNPFGPLQPPQNPECLTGFDGRAPCPMDCAIIRFTDENGCEVCKCDPDNPGHPFGPFGPPPPPPPRDSIHGYCPGSGQAACPMDCAIIRVTDENGCEVCKCDPDNPGHPFGPFGPPPPPPRDSIHGSCPGSGQAPCPMDCAIIRVTDENGCEVCKCDPDNPGHPFGPFGPPPPPPPQNRLRRSCPGSGQAPCPLDCAIIRVTDENGCEVCKCDPNNPGHPFGPFGPPPPPPQYRVHRSCPGNGQAPCPLDCAIIRVTDKNGCEVCKCDPNNSGHPFGPFGPFCPGSGQAPCPLDCAIIRSIDENGCESCECDSNNPGSPFFPHRPPPKFSFYP